MVFLTSKSKNKKKLKYRAIRKISGLIIAAGLSTIILNISLVITFAIYIEDPLDILIVWFIIYLSSSVESYLQISTFKSTTSAKKKNSSSTKKSITGPKYNENDNF